MFRIVYSSRLDPAVGRAEIEAIIADAQSRNARDDVTGAWLMKGYDCLSALEGPPGHVRLITERIWDDRRHSGFRLHDMRAANRRLFTGWPLHFVDMDHIDPADLDRHEGLRWLCEFAGGTAEFAAHGLQAETGRKH